MKRNRLLTGALVLLLTLCVYVCAQAADIRPVDISLPDIDPDNGVFCLGLRDTDKINDGGWFTASLYLEDRYAAEQIEALAPGDTVLVNGKTWTVREVVTHEADEPGLVESYEIYTAEETDSYIVFTRSSDGYWICLTDDWSPVTHVADVRVMLPLPDRFEYRNDVLGEPLGMDGFLEEAGDSLVPYNTSCVFEDGMLVCVTHTDYPFGPENAPAEEPAGTAEAAEAVPVWQFCHGRRDGLETAVIRGYSNSCEEGPEEIEMTPEEIEEIRSVAINGVITGKANDMSVTGGTWSYTFETPEGEFLLSVEMYRGWIVDAATGMYNYSK